ncbi:nucleotide exchange factor GrpE [Mollicutes bacterium LVI A0078]|nr:nucleotide exchange factor GrpE [Mollicutes bacterium LVI A0075]WOO90796.1 nucleotide exchange factor GrpE [Mollicutes bacterium LVI A0078]
MSNKEKDLEQEIREMESEVETVELETEEVELEENIEPEVQEENVYEQKYLRLLADFDNLKRNNAKDVMNAKNNGKIEVFRELVDVLDNFERSMQYDPSTEDYAKGINMVHNQLIEKLENAGLEKVTTEGEMDANIHQAVMVDTVDDMEDDHIIETLQNGYKLEDRLIRPAMVKVNKK